MKRLEDAGYMGYDIKNAKGHYEVWKGNEMVCTADTYSEALSDIDEMLEATPARGEPKARRYRVWYTINNADEQTAYEDVYAESPEQAKKKVKAMYGNTIYKLPHDAHLLDAEGETMGEEEYERLAKGAGKEAQALLDFYEMSEEAGDLFMSVYDSLGLPNDGEWVIEPTVLGDKAKVAQLFNAVRKAIISKANEKQLHSLLSPRDQRYDADRAEDKLLKAFGIRVVYDSLEEIQIELAGELDKLVQEAYHEYCKCLEENKDGEFKYSEKLEELLNKIGDFTSSTTPELIGMFKEMAEIEGVKGKKRELGDKADSTKLADLLAKLKSAIKAEGFAGPNWGFEAKHVREGDRDFIVFEGNKEHQGSDEESDTATNLESIIEGEYPGSEFISWNEEVAGCKWELKNEEGKEI